MFCFKINTPSFFIFYFICLNVSSQDPDTFTSFQDGIYNDNTASTPWTTNGTDADGIPDSDDDGKVSKLAKGLCKAHVQNKRALVSDLDDSSSGEEDGGRLDQTRQLDILKVAVKKPGKLSRSTLLKMMELVGERLPPDQMEAELLPVVTAYLHGVLFVSHTQDKLGLRNTREFQTLAQAADQLLKGHIAACLDTLLQRWKALEKSIVDGNWNVARRHELLPPQETPLISMQESKAAHKAEKLNKDTH